MQTFVTVLLKHDVTNMSVNFRDFSMALNMATREKLVVIEVAMPQRYSRGCNVTATPDATQMTKSD